MENLNLKNLSYEELCQMLQHNEIGYLAFVTVQDESMATLYSTTMQLYGLPETDATAKGWLAYYEEMSFTDDATAEEVLLTF